jgi:cell division protein FtsI (penicillin-binding protein 3)/stage V sporulation protein D (sporulation-specific penicillin-binding protein)
MSMNFRKNLILFLFFLFGATIIGRLFYLQILNHKFYKALAQGQQNLLVEVQEGRGEIFLKNGGNLLPLATNKTSQFCYLESKEIGSKEEAAEKLAQILNLDKEAILEKIKEGNLFVKIKSKLTEEEIENLKKLNLKGVYLGQENLRYYPQESFLSQVIGFVGGEGNGQYGIEGFYDNFLRTNSQFLEGKRGLGGSLIFLNPKNLFRNQEEKNLVLTIDYNIQFKAEKLLAEQKESLDFERGQIIVLDPQTGKILALANFPNFNPNNYSQEKDLKIFQNPAVQELFEPGSVFKPIVMAAGLEEEKITPQTTYQDPGSIKIGNRTIFNYEKRKYPGDITMTEVLEKSINTGAVFAENQIGHQTFLKYIEKFGFFEKTGIDLQGEVFSQNEELKKGYEINFATASFGQGVAVTPIQLVRAFSAIANGGKLVRPYIVENPPNKIDEGENFVISRKTASQLTTMLVSVVEKGFAKRAKVPGYYIAGKTGTAQIPWSALGVEKKGYSDKTIQTFVGFGPAFDPKFLILIKLDNPKTKTAEYSAVPIFGELAKYIITLWQIPPDY